MNIGMLWFDNNPKTDLAQKVGDASAYYQAKYAKAPTLCFVHPTMLPPADPSQPATLTAAGIQIRANRSVLPNHFWLGTETAAPAGEKGDQP